MSKKSSSVEIEKLKKVTDKIFGHLSCGDNTYLNFIKNAAKYIKTDKYDMAINEITKLADILSTNNKIQKKKKGGANINLDSQSLINNYSSLISDDHRPQDIMASEDVTSLKFSPNAFAAGIVQNPDITGTMGNPYRELVSPITTTVGGRRKTQKKKGGANINLDSQSLINNYSSLISDDHRPQDIMASEDVTSLKFSPNAFAAGIVQNPDITGTMGNPYRELVSPITTTVGGRRKTQKKKGGAIIDSVAQDMINSYGDLIRDDHNPKHILSSPDVTSLQYSPNAFSAGVVQNPDITSTMSNPYRELLSPIVTSVGGKSKKTKNKK